MFVVNLVLLIFGFALLALGANKLIKGASGLAVFWGISPLIVGLTVVAYGTSAPELAATIFAAFRGTTEMAMGNVIGSNIANIGLIVGITALVKAIFAKPKLFRREYPLLIIFTLLTIAFSLDGRVSRLEGLMLLLCGFAFTAFQIFIGKKEKKNNLHNETATTNKPGGWSNYFWQVFIGSLFLACGAEMMIRGAIFFAEYFLLPKWLIGLTIIALGTSLPELATCLIAQKRGEDDLSLGNIVGSNVFNLVWVLGFAAMICPFSFSANSLTKLHLGLYTMLLFTLLLFLLAFFTKKISRLGGLFLLSCYLLYIAYLVVSEVGPATFFSG